MDDESYDGYDGGMYTGGGSKGYRGKTKIPHFRRIGYRKRRSRRNMGANQLEPVEFFAISVVITMLVTVLFQIEWLFASFYAVFVFYTMLTKNVNPIRFISKVLTGMGMLFFAAITFVFILDIMVDGNVDPTIPIAYGYIIRIPLLSWSIVWLLEGWINWLRTRKMAKENFKEKEKSTKLLLLKIAKISYIASIATIIYGIVNFLHLSYTLGFLLFGVLLHLDFWNVDLMIGFILLGKFLQWVAYKK
ncbi:hypothetical protein [Cytobacillus gottheilii]|uniref:hypothetical protein n=1 Tax=Cytobacillus gottheilii TaxID=859144 RepID=UPI0009BC5D09|nr:hypothetical protein [Cytobacillus gottheilii]